jgi:hypothetical protein
LKLRVKKVGSNALRAYSPYSCLKKAHKTFILRVIFIALYYQG